MTTLKSLFSMLAMTALLSLAACGGGGGSSGTNVFNGSSGTGSSPNISDLSLVLSASSITASTAATVTATVTALDANRNAVAGVPVTISADSDAVVTVSGTAGSVTNSAGVLTATLGIGANTTLRTINVKAVSGAVSKTATLQVVSASQGNTATTIDIIAAATAVGTGGDGVQISAFVKDSNNNTLIAAPVSFRADTGTLSNVSATTNSAGAATATFGSGIERSNRVANITVTSGSVSKTLQLPILGTKLTLSGPTALILGSTASFDVVATDSKGNPVSGAEIKASSSLGNALAVSGSSITSSSGQVRFTYTATSSGTDKLVFTGAGASVSPSPELAVSAQDFTFISPATTASIDVGKPTEVRVRLRSNGVPQANRTVIFATTSGSLSPTAVRQTSDGTLPACDNSGALLPVGVACVLVTSDSAGPLTMQASTLASDGSSTSTTLPLLVTARQPSNITLQISPTAIPPNTGATGGNIANVLAKVVDANGNPVQGVTVNFTRVTDNSGGNLLQASAITDASGQASVAYRSGGQTTANNGVELQAALADFPNLPPVKATLTVNQAALFIALGTGNAITNVDPQTYKKDWVAYVTDSNGIPVSGATLTVKALPTAYRTGRLAWNGVSYEYSGAIWQCRNEDANRNGTLDSDEDDNKDGVLWPGNVISVTPGNIQTVNGLATLSLVYAESYVPWVRLELTASAIVAGTESRTTVEFTVVGVSTDFTVVTNPPAGLISPFGETPKSTTGCTRIQ